MLFTININNFLGLYFNKAADSCDYTQNVLCNKKLQKVTTSSATSSTEGTSGSSISTTAASFLFSTSRAPPKITAATSKTTIRQTTTTEAYEVRVSRVNSNSIGITMCIVESN